jgi:hypothetical protein
MTILVERFKQDFANLHQQHAREPLRRRADTGKDCPPSGGVSMQDADGDFRQARHDGVIDEDGLLLGVITDRSSASHGARR